jgi:hypothetical protein
MSWRGLARNESQPNSGTIIIRIKPTVSEKLEGGGVQAGPLRTCVRSRQNVRLGRFLAIYFVCNRMQHYDEWVSFQFNGSMQKYMARASAIKQSAQTGSEELHDESGPCYAIRYLPERLGK